MYLIVLAKRMLINANYVLCDTKVKIIYRVSFLVKCNSRWSIKKYFWNAAWRSWGFPNFSKVPNTYKICACMTDIKLNIKASRWNWDPGLKVFYFIELEKSIHQERLNYLIRDQNASIRWFLVDAAYKKLLLLFVKNTWSSSQ